MNKASGGDGIPVELFQIQKNNAVKVLHSICQQIWKTQQWPQDWQMSVFIPIPKNGNAKECSIYRLHSFHMLVRLCSKSFKLGFSSTWTENFHMFKLHLEKVKKTEVKLPTSTRSQKNQRNSKKKKIQFCFIDYAKVFDCVDHSKLWEILSESVSCSVMPDSLQIHGPALLLCLYSSLENRDRGAVQVHGFAKSQAWLNN